MDCTNDTKRAFGRIDYITAVNALTELLVLSSPMKNRLSSGCYGIVIGRVRVVESSHSCKNGRAGPRSFVLQLSLAAA